MKILINIGHPAHVHFFKYFIRQLEKDGHQVIVVAWYIGIVQMLLNAYNIRYRIVGKRYHGLTGIGYSQIKYEYDLYKLIKKTKPDILLGIGGTAIAHVGKLLRKPSVVFTDSESAKFANCITFPFTTVVLTPACYKIDLGKKHVRFNGYKELAYLHPNHFKPDAFVMEELGLKKHEKFVIIRFIAWQASHDIGQYGFTLAIKRKLVNELSKHARVLITSEHPLPDEFEEYRITTSPEKIHDLIYYATLLLGDSQTMTTEAGILGTPAIRCNSFVGPDDMSNFIELEQKYGLIYCYREPDKAIQRALELLHQPDLKEQWAKKRQKLLADKIDVTSFMVDFIEDYPESFKKYIERST